MAPLPGFAAIGEAGGTTARHRAAVPGHRGPVPRRARPAGWPGGLFCETANDAIRSVRVCDGLTGDDLLIDLWRVEDGDGTR
jgi:hypothetical protein